MMKKIICFVIVLALVSVIFVGCADKIKDTTYYEYGYDAATCTFVKTGMSVTFSDGGKAFKYSAYDAFSIFGTTIKMDGGYLLKASDDVSEAIIGFDKLKTTDPERYALLSEYNSVSVSQQFYVADKRLFSSHDIALMKTSSDGNLSAVDGIYDNLDNDDLQYRFENGKVYSITIDDKGVATEASSASARYYLQDGIITLVPLDVNGDDRVIEGRVQTLSYLFATVKCPDNIKEVDYGDDDYSKAIKAEAEQLAGKFIAVMAKSYYSEK